MRLELKDILRFPRTGDHALLILALVMLMTGGACLNWGVEEPSDGDANADADFDTDIDADLDSSPDGDSDVDQDVDTFRDADSDQDSDIDEQRDTGPDGDAVSDADADLDLDLDRDTELDRDADTDGDSPVDADADADEGEESDGDVDADAGPTWRTMDSGVSDQLNAIWGTSDDNIFAVGAVGWIIHYNGREWTGHDSGTEMQLADVWGSSATNVYTVGLTDTTDLPHVQTVLRFTGGTSWSHVETGYTTNLISVHGTSANDVWAVGEGGQSFHFDGDSWSNTRTGHALWLRHVHSFGSSDAWAVGDHGLVFHFTGSWTNIPSGTSDAQYFWGVWGATSSEVFVAGGPESTIMRLVGSELVRQDIDGGITALAGSSGENVFGVGAAGRIVHFNGDRWIEEDSGTREGLRGVWMAPSGRVYVAGHSGTILVRE